MKAFRPILVAFFLGSLAASGKAAGAKTTPPDAKTTPSSSSAAPASPARPSAPAPSLLGLTAFAGALTPADYSINWIAGVEFDWRAAEPEKGKIDWSAFDAKIARIDTAGTAAIPILVCRSSWGASPIPDSVHRASGAETLTTPADLAAWKEFVTKVVERYDGDGEDDMPGLVHPVHSWQLMPDLAGTWVSDRQSTLDYLQATSEAILSADPRALTILGSLTDADVDLVAVDAGIIPVVYVGRQRVTHGVIRGIDSLLSRVTFINDILKEGKNFYAIIDIHHLVSSGSALERMRFIEAHLAKNSIGKKPVWSLYNAVPSMPEAMPDEASVGSEMVRAAFGSILGGCRRFAWPAEGAMLPPNNVLAPYPLVDREGKAQPVQATFAELARRLRGLDKMNIWSAPSDAPDAMVVSVETATIAPFVVVWNEKPKKAKATFPAALPVEIVDAVTGETKTITPTDGKVTIEIGPSPVYLTHVFQPGTTPPEPPPPPKKSPKSPRKSGSKPKAT